VVGIVLALTGTLHPALALIGVPVLGGVVVAVISAIRGRARD
jgi:hypothetical protein